MGVSDKIDHAIERSSWIREMFEEGQRRKLIYGADRVFDFSLGNPDLEPPESFKEALKRLLQDSTPGRHGYMPNAGLEDTRQAVAEYLSRLNGIRFSSADIVMTVGAGGGLNVVFRTILNPQDEVVIPSPYFVEYNFYLENHSGVPVLVKTKEDFSLDLDLFEKNLGERTKAVLINSPNNPTGKVYTEQEIEALGNLLRDKSKSLGHPIYLISDEPYRKIVYDGVKVPSIFRYYKESFVVTSFSKDLSVPGERIGYVAVHPEISDGEKIRAGLVLSNRILGYVNAPALMQRVIKELLDESVDISIYKRRRNLLCDALESFGYEFTRPQGAFYLFPRSPIEDDVEFVRRLQEENILVVPGSGFGGPGHFRIAYCVSERVIEGALPGFEKAIKELR
ncbi:MAG TPA: pyridoxal phosphate-dependent aminotransferase [Desulfobacteraceae bacterium]|nr:pyridoxal phosphate-dependent aminotransferase [Desulfobacteraceae bacterium]